MSSTQHAPTHSQKHSQECEQLERQMWELMAGIKLKDLEKKMSEDFTSIHIDGPRNRKEELDLIKHLHLAKYYLSNFRIKEHGDTMIVTYIAQADETVNHKHLSSKAAARMSVWRKDGEEWKWIAHANLHSL